MSKHRELPQKVGITDESQLSSPFNPGLSRSEMFTLCRLAGESAKQIIEEREQKEKLELQKPEIVI